MGVVYEAEDLERGARVALKTLRQGDANYMYRLKQEFRSLQDIQHPNLAGLGELICDGGRWFFTMELVDGVNIVDWVRGPGAATGFDDDRLRASFRQVALAVSALHTADRIHRDIKPSNVLVEKDGRVVLLDFGLVAARSARQRSSDVPLVGTAEYMAPEQAASKRAAPPADWYSVGAVLYEALTGRPPFMGPPLEVLVAKQKQEPQPARLLAADVPPDMDSLCSALLRVDSSRRPQAREVLSRLGASAQAVASAATTAFSERSLAQGGPFVGRAHELGVLRQGLEDVRGGSPVSLLLFGASGIGKTAVAKRFVEDAVSEAKHTVVLAGRCYERESVPYKAFDGIVDALSRHLEHLEPGAVARLLPDETAVLARVFPVLRRVSAIARAPRPKREIPSPIELRTHAFSALRDLLGRIAVRSPMIIYIDDLQWADADSFALLHELMRPVTAPPLFLIMTARSTAVEPAQLEAPLETIADSLPDLRFLRLGGLPEEDARELASLLVTRMGSPAKAPEAIAEEAGGHPLFIDELVLYVASGGATEPGGMRLDDALWARIGKLEEPARNLLELSAINGVPLKLETLARAANLDHTDLGRWIAVLRVSHLVQTTGMRNRDTLDVYHDRVRDAVLTHLRPESVRGHHAKLAWALEAVGAVGHDQQLLVRHLDAAGEVERAAVQAEQVAAAAAQALAFDRAADFYRTAIRLGSFEGDRLRSLHTELGDALSNSGRGSEAASHYMLAAKGASAAMRLELQRRAAEQLLTTGHLDQGMATLASVVDELGVGVPSSENRAIASIIWQRIKLRARGFRWTARDESEISAAVLTRIDVYQGVAFGLAMVDPVRGYDFQLRFLLAALRAGEPTRVARAIGLEAHFLAAQGGRSLARAPALIEIVKRMARESGDPLVEAWGLGAEAFVAYFSGRFRESADHMREAEVLLRERTRGSAWEVHNVRIFRLLAMRYIGDCKELGRWYEEYVSEASRRGDLYSVTTLKRAFNVVWLMRDRTDMARRELKAASWSEREGGYHLQHWYQLRAWAELDLYANAGQAGAARARPSLAAFERSTLARVTTVSAETLWIRGRLALASAAAALHPPAREMAIVATLVRQLERESFPPSRVWARLLAAGRYYQRSNRSRALDALEVADALAEQSDLQLYSAAALRRQGEIVGGDRGAALVERADEWMREQGIVNPERMAETIAPGFRRGGAPSPTK